MIVLTTVIGTTTIEVYQGGVYTYYVSKKVTGLYTEVTIDEFYSLGSAVSEALRIVEEVAS